MTASSHRRGRPPHPDVLTPAEWRIAHAVRHGMSTRMIAERQGVSVDAVKFHLGNIMDKLGLESREQLRSWAGIPIDSALRRGSPSEGEESMTEMRLGPIGQISRRVSDIDTAVAWYRDVLRLPHLYTFGDIAFFDAGGTRLFLTAVDETAGRKGRKGPNGETPETGESILYFRVDDIHAASETLVARGVSFTSAPHLIHRHESGVEEWLAFFIDPDGHALALMAQTPPGPVQRPARPGG